MRKLLRGLLIVVGLVHGTGVHAAKLLINGDGFLTGATGVEVAGSLYDVQFIDGTCNALFDGCDEQLFAFPDVTAAALASTALLEQVFTGTFDSVPNLTVGCRNDALTAGCGVLTPYDVSSDAIVATIELSNDLEESFDRSVQLFFPRTLDTTTLNYLVYAHWSPAQQLPGTSISALLVACALAAMGAHLLQRRT